MSPMDLLMRAKCAPELPVRISEFKIRNSVKKCGFVSRRAIKDREKTANHRHKGPKSALRFSNYGFTLSESGGANLANKKPETGQREN